MGLDQYAHTRNQKVDFGKVYEDDYNPCVDGFYWRKHSRLQTFMANKYHELNPEAEDFNGEELVLTKEILMELRQEIDSSYHQSFCSGGFFWGMLLFLVAKDCHRQPLQRFFVDEFDFEVIIRT